MKFSTRILSTVVTTAALFGAGQASAVTTWAFSYTGAGTTAAGTFTTAGAAGVAEDILSISGTRNGQSILGLVPVDGDPSFFYDNQFAAPLPHFTDGGMLYNTPGNVHVNVYFFEGQMYEVLDGIPEVPINFTVTAVPEAATYAYMALGLAGIGALSLRRRAGQAA